MEFENALLNTVITVGSGKTVSGMIWDSGETVTVTSGGVLDGAELTHRAESLVLESGAILKGTLTVGAPVTLNGTVNAAEADSVLNISRRKEEEGLLWNDIAAAEAKSYSLTVDSNQDKGTYRLAGNASEFDGVITIKNSAGTELGTLSLSNNTLDFDITRYTLALNETGELTVTISSNITDDSSYVFLYKENHLISHLPDGYGLEVSSTGEYDHLVVIDKGVAGNIKIKSGGVVTVYEGAIAAGLEQDIDGKLRLIILREIRH